MITHSLLGKPNILFVTVLSSALPGRASVMQHSKMSGWTDASRRLSTLKFLVENRAGFFSPNVWFMSFTPTILPGPRYRYTGVYIYITSLIAVQNFPYCTQFLSPQRLSFCPKSNPFANHSSIQLNLIKFSICNLNTNGLLRTVILRIERQRDKKP